MSKKNSQSFPRCTLCKGVINILGNSYVVGATGRMVCRSCLEKRLSVLKRKPYPRPRSRLHRSISFGNWISPLLDRSRRNQP